MGSDDNWFADYEAGKLCGYWGSPYSSLGADIYDAEQRQRLAEATRSTTYGGGTRVAASQPSTPWFAGVDDWFDRHVSLAWRRRITIVNVVFWAFIGYSYGIGSGMSGSEAFWFAGGGALAGLIVIPLVVVAIKLALLGAILAIGGLVLWALVAAVAS